jgi:hypothetical protein
MPVVESLIRQKLLQIREQRNPMDKLNTIKPMIICGVDPGANGGIAIIIGSDAYAWKHPETEDDLVALFEEIQLSFGLIDLCMVEKQHSMPATAPHPTIPGQTVTVQGVTSTWSFAEGYGVIRGVLAALRIKREFIAPQTWQKALGIPKREKTESHTQFKNRLKQKAQELFPGFPMTLALCDALLIAETGRRIYGSV